MTTQYLNNVVFLKCIGVKIFNKEFKTVRNILSYNKIRHGPNFLTVRNVPCLSFAIK
jgi:hypothetical protein